LGGGTVERIAQDGTRSTVLEGIASPAGIAIDATGAVFASSYSGDYIVRIAPDGTQTRVESNKAGLSAATGIGKTIADYPRRRPPVEDERWSSFLIRPYPLMASPSHPLPQKRA